MPQASIVDLSHYNVVTTLTEATKVGIRAVIHKCTEGVGSIDVKCAARYHLTKEAGLLWGLYHFLRPGDMYSQVKNFINRATAAGVLDDETLLACDLEVTGVTLNQVIEFLQTVESLAGRTPVLYSGHTLKELLTGSPGNDLLKKYRLWMPQYSATPVLPPGYDSYWAWQYTDKGQIPGIVSTVDLSACTQFENWSGRAEAPPSPSPETVSLGVSLPTGVPLSISVNGVEVYRTT